MKTGTQPRQHGEANPGTVRAFHEEARAAPLSGESGHTRVIQAHVPERACRFEACLRDAALPHTCGQGGASCTGECRPCNAQRVDQTGLPDQHVAAMRYAHPDGAPWNNTHRFCFPGSRPGLPHEDTVRTPRTSSDPTVPYPQAGPTRIGSPAVAGTKLHEEALDMAKLKKLSKSEKAPAAFEVLPYGRKDGTTVWLWACDQGCYDDTPYDRSDPVDAERTAQRHVSRGH